MSETHTSASSTIRTRRFSRFLSDITRNATHMDIKKLVSAMAIASALMVGGIANAQTSGSGSSGTSGATIASSTQGGSGAGTTGSGATSTPGSPNTGAGGDAITNAVLLLGSGLIVIAGGLYLYTRREASR